jgi:hypothetical protein
MTKNGAAWLLAIGVGLGLVQPAYAWQSGVICNPDRASLNLVSYGWWGIQNDSTTSSARVYCSDGTGASNVFNTREDVVVGVYDRDPIANVCCTAKLQDVFGRPVSRVVSIRVV